MNPKICEDRITPHPEVLQRLLEDTTMPEMTYCQLFASMLLAQWQISNSFPTNHPPSFILVSTGTQPDFCMQMAQAAFRYHLPKRRPKPVPPDIDPITQTNRSFDEIAFAEQTMQMRVLYANKRGPLDPKSRQDSGMAMELERERNAQHEIIYGSVKAGFYTRNIHPTFGVATDQTNRVSLWVTSPKDLASYKSDIKDPDSILWKPWGYDAGYKKCAKHVSIIGSIPAEEWSTNFVGNVVEQSAPVLFLPHVTAQTPSASIDEFEINKLMDGVTYVENSIGGKLPPPDCRFFPGQFRAYENLLRYRLRLMPADYEFHILQLIRQLRTRHLFLCSSILTMVPADQKDKWTYSLLPMIFESAMRGIAFGVESLVFHGYGLLVGPYLALSKKMLTHIRQHGPCSGRDLQRKFQTIEKETRESLLNTFANEGLIVREQNQISAVSCRDFLASLPTRPLVPKAMTLDGNQTQAASTPSAAKT
jgi:hypothetical protein